MEPARSHWQSGTASAAQWRRLVVAGLLAGAAMLCPDPTFSQPFPGPSQLATQAVEQADGSVAPALDSPGADELEDSVAAISPGWLVQISQVDGQQLLRRTSGGPLWGLGDDLLLAGSRRDYRRAKWQGQLVVEQPGSHRFKLLVQTLAGESAAVDLAARVQMTVEGQPLEFSVWASPSAQRGLDQADRGATESAGKWLISPAVELPFGAVEVELSVDGLAQHIDRLALYWQGPRLRLEPVSSRWMRYQPPAEGLPPDVQTGADLADALRCGACHDWPGREPTSDAPNLSRAGDMLQPLWLVDWLQTAGTRQPARGSADPSAAAAGQSASHSSSAGHARDDLQRGVSHPLLAADEAQAVAQVLLSQHRSGPPAPAASSSSATSDDVAAGERLFFTVGCLACHQLDDLGTTGPLAGGSLTWIAEKRPELFFEPWLSDPAALNSAHRMPVFPLNANERRQLAVWLATRRRETAARPTEDEIKGPPTDKTQAMAQTAISRHRCAACHAGLPAEPPQGRPASEPRLAFTPQTDWNSGCLSAAPAGRGPHYHLHPAERHALTHYLAERAAGAPPVPQAANPGPTSGRAVLRRALCLGCHAREESPGIRGQLPELGRLHPDLAPRLAALAPPSLTAIGDKLEREPLRLAVTDAPGQRRRPWLEVWMPKFDLPPAELEALLDYLTSADEVPLAPDEAPSTDPDPAAWRAAGGRLVTTDGFGCTSCHAVGSVVPEKVALAAQGPQLAGLGSRIRRQWFDRWVRNPARIVPQMEMPAIQLPVHGVLGDQLEPQLAAVWHALNQPGFEPPRPNPVRTIRRANLSQVREPALVLTDLVHLGRDKLVHPIVVGLPNRHNLVFDLEGARLAGWWLGDTASQRIKGKSWFWEPAGPAVAVRARGPSQWSLLLPGGAGSAGDLQPTALEPAPQGQWRGQLDQITHLEGGGVEVAYRLAFATEGGRRQLQIRERYWPVVPGQGPPPGWLRQANIAGLLAGEQLRWTVWIEPLERPTPTASSELRVETPLGPATIRRPSGGPGWEWVNGQPAILLSADAQGRATASLEYRLATPADQYRVPAPTPGPQPPAPFNGFPGFDAVRLPLASEEMPTGLAWRDDGTLVVSSLKGQVFLAHDRDRDGLEDELSPLSDELACPFGVATAGTAVDVINKWGLARLWDDDGDGRAERTEVLADGWAHTDDYHDWAVGLPRDRQGRYYVALACQQDRRTPLEWYLRGSVVRLVPEVPTPQWPRRFRVEPFCAGLRFPMGLALDSEDRLWASDNQGNYTPFNELNWLRPGRHYGFPNRWEEDQRQSSAGSAADPPAAEPPTIEIPHPWTRSINGLAWLRTPAEVAARRGPIFGPWEGHLVGCEYDTRRLVRMTIDAIDDEQFQGAVYPFSQAPDQADGDGPLGPLVAQVAPDGDLYLGSIRDSAWGGGSNTGELIRLAPTGSWPLGIAEVRATPEGFRLRFSAAVDRQAAGDPRSYHLERFRRQATADYGGPDLDRGPVLVTEVRLDDDDQTVWLKVDQLTEGFVFQFRVGAVGGPHQTVFPDEAYYTLRRIPRKPPGP